MQTPRRLYVARLVPTSSRWVPPASTSHIWESKVSAARSCYRQSFWYRSAEASLPQNSGRSPQRRVEPGVPTLSSVQLQYWPVLPFQTVYWLNCSWLGIVLLLRLLLSASHPHRALKQFLVHSERCIAPIDPLAGRCASEGGNLSTSQPKVRIQFKPHAT